MTIKAPFLYLSFLAWIIILGILLFIFHLNVTGLGITLAVLTLIFAPGVFLWRLFHFEDQKLWQKILSIITFGFIFYFIINLLGLLVHLNINQLIFAIFFFSFVLFGLACFEDRQAILKIDLVNFKKQTLGDWLLYSAVLLGAILAFLGVDAQQEKLVGDGAFHLAIIEKIISSQSLASTNIWVTKGSGLNIVYSFPIWHIFIAFLAKTLKISIYTAYIQVLLPLVILTFFVVWGFSKSIFKNKYIAFSSFFAFIIYFWIQGHFLALIPLRSPDSLNRLLIFPLVLALCAGYFYDNKSKFYKNAILISILSICLGLIHFTQLIDLILILIVFLILVLIFDRKKEYLIKFGFLGLGLVILIIPYLLIFQFENVKLFFQGNIAQFTGNVFVNSSYKEASNLLLYAIFSLPVLILLSKNKRHYLLILSIPITLILISWQVFHLRNIFLKYLGEIFTIRAISDLPVFVFFGFLVFFICWLINLISNKNKISLQVLSIILVIGSILVFLTPLRINVNKIIDEAIFSYKNQFLLTYFPIILVGITIICIAIAIYICMFKKDIPDFKVIHKSFFAVWLLVIYLILVMPYIPGLFKSLKQNPNKSIVSNRSLNYVGDIQRIGGEKTIEFVQTLPPESIFVSSNVTVVQNVLLYTPSYAFEYPFGITEFSQSGTIYNPNLSFDDRKQIIDDNRINYIITLRPYETELFNKNPSNFEEIFTNSYTYTIKTKDSSYEKQGEFTVFKVSQ